MGVSDLEQRAVFGRIALPQRCETRVQLPHDGIVPPVGMISKVGHHSRTLRHLADAFERLVFS